MENLVKSYTLFLGLILLNIPIIKAQNSIYRNISSYGTISYPAIRKIDFETGDFSQIEPGDIFSHRPEDIPILNNEIVHGGSYSVKCSLPGSGYDAGSSFVRMKGFPLIDLYYDWWIYINEGYDAGSNWNMICEWYPQNSIGANHHVAICFINAHGIKNNLFFNFRTIHVEWEVPGASSKYECAQIYSDIEMPTGRWVHFNVIYRYHASSGQIVVKMDGQNVLIWNGKTTFNSTSKMQWGFGTYCSPDNDPHSFYFDDIIIYE
ncbi:MAG: heparin lyase I family protein [Candidatus Hodarchaeota archaeon]